MSKKNREDIVENEETTKEIYGLLPEEIKNKIEWFKDQKIGIIFHWGLYSQAGIVESWQLSKEDDWARKNGAWRSDLETLRKDYWNLDKSFNPSKFNPDEWAKESKEAGFRYMIFTTRHHDGFNMYDTKYSEYKITNSRVPFSKNKNADVFKALSDSFRSEDLSVGAYYSKPDWHSEYYWEKSSDPEGRYASYNPLLKPKTWLKFNNYVENQLSEICENYGPIDILWLDGGWVNSENNEFLDMEKIAQKIRKIRPDTLIVDRTIGGEYENYVTPERKIPNESPSKAWESNIPLAKNWGYVPNDEYKEIYEILDSVIKIVSKGGNVILGVGPKPDGTLPMEAKSIMKNLGEWLKIFGEAIYETRPVNKKRNFEYSLTKKNNDYFIFFSKKEYGKSILLDELNIKIKRVKNLENDKDIPFINGMIEVPSSKFTHCALKIEIK